MQNGITQRTLVDMWCEERAMRSRGIFRIAGIDEAGRGPLAGPVVASCVVLPFEIDLPRVNDSKKMVPKDREEAYDTIISCAEAVGIGIIPSEEIDRLNILRATHEAMRRALAEIMPVPEVALIDGRPVHPFPILQKAIVKGDSLSKSIAAASIVAKVTRDRIMVEADSKYPGYGFAAHKGYPTEDHIERLQKLGPCAIHRRSFGPVREAARDWQDGSFDFSGKVDVGHQGEQLAADWLRERDYVVLDRRFRATGGELDIVARDGDTIVFVEVKTLRRGSDPAEAVNRRKRARLQVAAEAWLHKNALEEGACRFDIMEVLMPENAPVVIRHYPNAFMCGE